MNRILSALGLLTFLLVFAGLFWWLRGPEGSGSDKGGKAFTHTHCPDCQLEVPFSKGMENRSCPHCGSSGPKMIATVGPYKEGGASDRGSSGIGTGLAAATIALVLVQAGIYGWILYDRSRRRAQEAEQLQPLVCRCPFCSRKIGYLPRKIGSPTICARCKTSFTLPEVGIAQEEEAS
jgi:cbb3-type cytochrome oxidase subunit 3